MSKYGVISGPYFPVFGLNADQKKFGICTLFTQCKFDRIGFSVKCFRGDFLKFSKTAVKMFIYAKQLAFGFNCKHFRVFVENSLFPRS